MNSRRLIASSQDKGTNRPKLPYEQVPGALVLFSDSDRRLDLYFTQTMDKAPDVDLERRLRAVEEAVQYIARNLATINANMAKMQRSVTSVQKTQHSVKLTLESLVQKTAVEDILALTLSLQDLVEQIAVKVRNSSNDREAIE
jgi:hypothetical protein